MSQHSPQNQHLMCQEKKYSYLKMCDVLINVTCGQKYTLKIGNESHVHVAGFEPWLYSSSSPWHPMFPWQPMQHFATGNPLHQVSFITLVAGQSFVFFHYQVKSLFKRRNWEGYFKVNMLHKLDLEGSKNCSELCGGSMFYGTPSILSLTT